MDGDQQEALDLAAAETYRRIDDDLSESPEMLRPILTEIRRRLYDAAYRPPRLGGKRAGVETPARAFRGYMGETPADYVRGARLETSMRLLRDSDLTIGAIALLVGYADSPGFRQAFRNWFGMPPRSFHDRVRRISERSGWPDDEILSLRLWKGATAGEEAAIERLREWVRVLHPRAKIPPAPEPAPAEKICRSFAARLWSDLSGLSPAEQRRVLRHEIFFGHPALFHHLAGESSRAEDPRRALELAELASAAVEGSAESLGELRPGLRFLARTRLAEARRLAGPRGVAAGVSKP